jgi:hypothetical protein
MTTTEARTGRGAGFFVPGGTRLVTALQVVVDAPKWDGNPSRATIDIPPTERSLQMEMS